MFFTAKKLISSLFLAISLSSVLLLLPFETRAELDGQSEGTQAQNDPNDPAYTGAAQETGTTPTAQATIADTVKFGCDIWTGTGLLNCLLDIEYGVLVGVSRNLFKLAGHIFDTIWAFGLSSDSYKQDDFIGAGWIVCRDISNTFFIFILLYIAITTILQIGSTKQLLSTVIIVALLMNFSLYLTRFVIDIGNMFALEFYSTFPEDKHPAVIIPGIERHSIANGYQNALIVPLLAVAKGIPGQGGKEAFAVKAAMIALVGIEFLVVTFVFLIVSFLLIGRLATLWIVMIVSPLAFFSIALPSGVSGASGIWGKWKGHLISQTFFPAIFLFFMYFAARLANGSSYVLTTFGSGTATGIMVFIPLAIRFAIIIAFIMYGLQIATRMSGDAGKMAAAYGGTAVLGGAALAGRQVGGRVANWARKDREAGGLGLGQSLSTSRVGRLALSGINQAAEGTWDVRSSSVGEKVIGASGASLGKVGGQGGFAKQAQETKRKYKEVYDSLKGNPEAQAKMVANLRKFGEGMVNINGAEQRIRINPDRDVKDLMSSLSIRERMELIEKAQGKDKEYLSNINKGLAEEALPEKRKEEIKSEYDFLKDKPKAQAEFIANLHTSGKQDLIAPLMKKLSAKERYNAIMESGGDTRKFLEEVNAKVMKDLKPDQKIKDQKEWEEAETLGSFKESLKDYKIAREGVRKASEEGDMEQIEIHKKAMEEHKKAVGDKINTLKNEQLTGLDTEDLLEESVVQGLSGEKIKAIKKKSGSKFTLAQEKEFDEIIKKKNESEVVRDGVDLTIANATKRKKTEEIYIPTGPLSEEIRIARNTQNPSPST